MTIDANTVVSMSEANQNFSKVARMVDQYGKSVIFKNNSPKYMVLDFTIAEKANSSSYGSATQNKVTYITASDEEAIAISEQLMKNVFCCTSLSKSTLSLLPQPALWSTADYAS